MKRHLNALLQRKYTEFEGPRETHRSPQVSATSEATAVQMKDGYDWLALIKGNQTARVSVRG
ncbi:MAG: hypothetical protein ACREPQ_17795 [Rhodanobacter sp.]